MPSTSTFSASYRSFSISFHYSGKLDTFDYEVYWIKILAQAADAGLVAAFRAGFPGTQSEGTGRSLSKLSFVYLPPLAILFVHVSTASGWRLGWFRGSARAFLLDKIAYSYLGVCFLAAGVVFYRNYRGAPAGVLAAATEMAHCWNLYRHFSVCRPLHRAVCVRCGVSALDEILDCQPGLHPAVLWIRHHSLPSDGCGHYLQARPGLYRGNRCYRHDLLLLRGADPPDLSRAGERPHRRHHRHCHCGASLPTLS